MTLNTTCPNYVPQCTGAISAVWSLQTGVVREICNHHDLSLLCNAVLAPSSSKKEVCTERDRRERTLLCCREQLQNPCMRKVNQREKLCTSSAQHAAVSSSGPDQEGTDWAWLSRDVWAENKLKISFVFRPPDETGTSSRNMVIQGTSQWQSLQGSAGPGRKSPSEGQSLSCYLHYNQWG